MNDAPEPDGYERCGADKKHGRGPCKLPAGHGTSHPGVGHCRRHGGNTPTHVAAAERQMAEQEAARFGLDTVEVGAGEALLREVRRSAAMVDWLAARVAALSEDELTWGVAGRRITPSPVPGGTPQVVVEQRSRIHPLVAMLERERLLLARVAEAAHRCGIEDRLLRRAELDGALIAEVIHAILYDPELALKPENWAAVPRVVPRHLRAMDAGRVA